MSYTEDTLVQRTTAEYFEKELGCSPATPNPFKARYTRL